MKWFGKSWNPRACRPTEHAETPTGEKCVRCTSHIEDGDQGIILFCAVAIDINKEVCEVRAEAYHLDCFLRGMLPPEFLRKHPGAVSRDFGKN